MRIEPLLEWCAPGTVLDDGPPVVATVWRVTLDICSAELDRAHTLLAADERARAAQFRFPVHRCRFVAARAALRMVLGEQLAVDPRDLVFHYTAEGKPELTAYSDLYFNMSHSDDICMIAIARGRRLGIDVEKTRTDRALIEEVARSLHPVERQALAALEPPLLEKAFYRCWVRKEALLKALGIGVGEGLDRCHVSLGEEPRLIWADPTLLTGSDWTLIELGGEGYAAALAIECASVRARARLLSSESPAVTTATLNA